jgi:Fe-S-cluster containining protein
MSISFACVGCGRCCHGLRLPLSVSEAIGWLERGGAVEILCDAAPAVPSDDPQARHRAERAVPATSGALAIGVSITLAAVFAGACPNLLPDMRCGAYAVRPDACRIYPAELRPGLPLTPAAKLCPADAWDADRPAFLTGETVHDAETAAAIARARAAGPADVPAKARLAALLGMTQAALANEGFVVWRPDGAILLDALRLAKAGDHAPLTAWTFVSEREATRGLIADAGAAGDGPARLPHHAELLPLYG